MTDSEWTPLLTGSAADVAWGAIDAIARALRERDLQFPMGSPTGLACGAAGVALFFHALALARPGEGFERDVARFLEDASASEDPRFVLFNGVPGVAWTADRIAGPWDGEPDPNDELDGAIDAYLDRWPRADFDLVSGIVGIGVYSLGRLPRRAAAANVARVVRILAEAAAHDAEGAKWPAPPKANPDRAADSGATPGPSYDLGMAHGQAGVVAFLGAARSAPTGARDAGLLLDEAVRWLRAHRSPSFGYGAVVRPKEPTRRTRSAWCYGNPGVAVALILAGRATGEEEWVREGAELLAVDASRTPEDGGVIDTSLCHGSMGLAHLCNRAFQATREQRLAYLARRWADHALVTQRRPGRGFAGFAFFGDAPDEMLDPSLLTGAAGVGAALLALVAASPPRWDGALLLDIPAPSARASSRD